MQLKKLVVIVSWVLLCGQVAAHLLPSFTGNSTFLALHEWNRMLHGAEPYMDAGQHFELGQVWRFPKEH